MPYPLLASEDAITGLIKPSEPAADNCQQDLLNQIGLWNGQYPDHDAQ